MSLQLHPRSGPPRVRDAAREGLALGLRRYLPETVGLLLFGLAAIALAALSMLLLGAVGWAVAAAAGVSTAGRAWRLLLRLFRNPP